MKTLTYEYVDKLLTKKGFKLIKVVENDFEDTDYRETNYIYQKGTVKLDVNTCDDEVVFMMISDKHNHHQSVRLDKIDEYIDYYNLLDSFEESKKTVRKSIKESKTMTFEEFKKLCNDNFGYAIMDFDEYKGAYIVVVSSNEKATELFTKALRKKGLECTFYELKDPNSEYYRCYEIMCV